MARVFLDFESEPTGSLPADFEIVTGSTGDFEIADDAGASNGKVLAVRQTDAASKLVRYTGLPSSDEFEFTARLRKTNGTNTSTDFGLGHGELVGDGRIQFDFVPTNGIRLRRQSLPNNTNFGEATTFDPGFIYYLCKGYRNQVTGDTKFKMWAEGNAEPDWQLEVVHTGADPADVLVLFAFNCSDVFYDWIGIGTDGDPAPTATKASSQVSREFSGDTLNAQPTDFTRYDNTTDGTWHVINDGTENVLRHVGTQTSNDKELAWDGVGAPTVKYSEVLIRCRHANVANIDAFMSIHNYDTASQLSGHAIGAGFTTSADLRVAGLNTFNEFSLTPLNEALVNDEWFYIRTRIAPSAGGDVEYKAKVWKQGDAEPSAWLVDTIYNRAEYDGSTTAYFAMQVWDNTDATDWAWISVGQNGWAAENLDAGVPTYVDAPTSVTATSAADPSVKTGVSITCSVSTSNVNALEPSVLLAATVTPSVAQCLVQSPGPLIKTGVSLFTSLAAQSVSTYNPQISSGVSITPSIDTTIVAANDPEISTIAQVIIEPAVSITSTSTNNPVITSGAASNVSSVEYTVTAHSPAIHTGAEVNVDASTIRSYSEDPFVGVSTIIKPTFASSSCTSNDPQIASGVTVTCTRSQLAIAANDPTISSGGSVRPTMTLVNTNQYTPIVEAGVDPYLVIIEIQGSYHPDADILGYYYLDIAI